MGKKTTIYIPDKISEFIAGYGENSLSGALATLIERYRIIVADNTPELSEQEWLAICDANNGCGIWLTAGGDVDNATYVWANIADAEDFSEKWGVDNAALAGKLRDLPIAGRIAAWDVAARFWATDAAEGESYRSMLERCGAKLLDIDEGL